ncbi:MAG: glycosyltransferase [Lachnospira sp.]
MDTLVSIVIPVYNVHAYLNDCLESLLIQEYSEIEIILVDDGSKDDSLKICREYEKKDKRVKVFHQENAGVIIARKKGVEFAKGDYIIFVDADDFVDGEYVSHLMKHAGSYDLVTSGVLRQEKYNLTTARKDGVQEGEYLNSDELHYLMDNMIFVNDTIKDGVLPYIYGKCFKKDLALKVMEEMMELDYTIPIYEDRAFVLCYIQRCERVLITGEIHYTYRYNNASVMKTKNNYFLTTLNSVYNLLNKYFSKYYYSNILKINLQKFVTNQIYFVSDFMAFDWRIKTIKFYPPFYEELKNKRIALYGAGEVGCNYYRVLSKTSDCKDVLWVDKDDEKIAKSNGLINSVDKLLDYEFDIVIIAVKSGDIAENIIERLVGMGISEDKIKWKCPIILRDL